MPRMGAKFEILDALTPPAGCLVEDRCLGPVAADFAVPSHSGGAKSRVRKTDLGLIGAVCVCAYAGVAGLHTDALSTQSH